MRFVIRLLLALSLAWCGLHLAEPTPAQAHDGPPGVAQLLDADCGELGEDAEPSSHLHHHHCPVAADPNAGATGTRLFADSNAALAARAHALHSLTRAPPLQPPLA